jgi:hypothetical protein
MNHRPITIPSECHPFSEDRRRELFLALVNAQDDGKSVYQSRATIAEQYRVTERQVRAIEREGLDNDWPPL